MRQGLAIPIVILVGCSGKETVPPGDTLEPPDTTPVIETGTEGGYIDAAFFAVIGRFAYDPDLGRHVGFAEPGEGPSPMQLSILFLDSSTAYSGLTEENNCSVTFELADPQDQAPWVETALAWTGFDVPPGSVVRDHCQGFGMPADFEGDVGAAVSQWSWGIGIGTLDEVVETQLRNTLAASKWAALDPYILGAAGYSSAFVGATVGTGDGLTTQGYGTAFEVDGNFEISESGTGNPLPVPKGDIDQEVGVARAYYEVTLGPFQPGIYLAQTPL